MKPNLIYIFADQLRYSSLSCHGDSLAQTPNIDEFAKESMELPNAVSGHPVCAPYRASLFTGKYTTSTGMVINEIRMNPNHKCFGHILGENGYTTAYIGKWHLYANELGNHYDPKNSFIPRGENRLGFDDYFAAYNFHHEYYGEKAYYHLETPEKIYCDDYEPDYQTNLAMEKLTELKGKDEPFALFLSLGTPHDPWIAENVPAKYLERFKDAKFKLPPNYLPENDKYADNWAKLKDEEREELTEWMRVYYAMTANLDDNIGRLISKIKELGLYDNSIIIFTSDHGELFGAHGRRAKNIFYDEAVRVPFMIRWKEHIATNEKNDVCINTVDIMPTLLDMMKLPIPKEVEGESVSKVLQKENGSTEPDGCLMMGTGATAAWEDGHEWRAWRTKQYTYATYLVDGSEYLFDNTKDPYQMNNLINAAEYKEIVNSLRSAMHKKMNDINDTFEKSSFYKENWVDEDRIIIKTATLNNK